MKILRTDIASRGKTILDPINVPGLVSGTERGTSSGVLTCDHLVISTISCQSHDDVMHAAGLDEDDIDWMAPVPGKGRVRLWLDSESLCAEFWYYGDDPGISDMDEPPVGAEALMAVVDWIREHPKIRQAYPSGVPSPWIDLWDGDVAEITWRFSGGRFERMDGGRLVCGVCCQYS